MPAPRKNGKHLACAPQVAVRTKSNQQLFAILVDYKLRTLRRLCGQERAKDVLSPQAQQRRGFTVSPIPKGSSLDGNVFDEALRDNTRSEVPDQVAFRMDFPEWLSTMSDRNRHIAEDMTMGDSTLELSGRHRVSPGRISQLRREFKQDWESFTGQIF